MPSIRLRRLLATLRAKAAAALLLVILGDQLFWARDQFGSAIGGFALAWIAMTLATQPALRRDRRALFAAAAATAYALILVDDPSLLGWTLFWAALALAALLPRTAAFDAFSWGQRLLAHALVSAFGPVIDGLRLRRARRGHDSQLLPRHLPVLALPIAGGAVFVALFAVANPIIGDAIASIRLPALNLSTVARWCLWVLLLTIAWSTLRPRRVRPLLPALDDSDPQPIPGVSIASVTLSLLLFNAIFAVQNGLDVAFLWSGAGLPDGVTLAEYTHRGAYPLIGTALLAGLFVLATLRPGSETAARPLIRRLVILWVAQNVFLVASTMLRTLDYVDVYLLTKLRIAALAWMLLVALGLILILWRMLRGRSAVWLVNMNCAVAAVVLSIASIVDLGSVAAAWNVRHAREVGGRGAPLDLCYMTGLGGSALVSLVELEQRPLPRDLRRRVVAVRHGILRDMLRGQNGEHWTWRNARRLDRVRTIIRRKPLPRPAASDYRCDGRPQPRPEPPKPAFAPLTAEPQR